MSHEDTMSWLLTLLAIALLPVPLQKAFLPALLWGHSISLTFVPDLQEM